jgi:hypothetical protein
MERLGTVLARESNARDSRIVNLLEDLLEGGSWGIRCNIVDDIRRLLLRFSTKNRFYLGQLNGFTIQADLGPRLDSQCQYGSNRSFRRCLFFAPDHECQRYERDHGDDAGRNHSKQCLMDE